MRKHLSLMLLLLLLITCTACGQRQTVQRMAADLHDYQDWYQQITALYPELF